MPQACFPCLSRAATFKLAHYPNWSYVRPASANRILDGLFAAPGRRRPEYKRADSLPVIASEAKQSRGRITWPLDCFVASLLAMTVGAPPKGFVARRAIDFESFFCRSP